MREEALHGTAIYNPGLLSPDELKRNFVARTGLLQKIVTGLRKEKPEQAPQHRLLLGLRGMGKTTLLHRLAVAVVEDGELSKTWLPLTFPEEQYNIANLADFWLNCLDALGDHYDSQGEKELAVALDKVIEALPSQSPDSALNALLQEASKNNKRLLLLIDNIDLVFKRLQNEDWALREVLQSNPNLLVVGASANAMEASYDYGAAFYDFFQVHELKGLNLKEMNDTLVRLSEINKTPAVIDLIKQDPARITTLHTLTGGNPRTTALLYSVLANGLEGSDVRSDLEGLLDRVTPLYKARFEEFPEKIQQLVDSIANHWDPISAQKLAERLKWSVNTVSAQLNRLEQQSIVEKTAPSEGKRALFQLSERFFNIWYLMRSSRRVRNNLIWLVRFLRIFFSADELQSHARRRLDKRSCNQRDAEYLVALAQSIDDTSLRTGLENHAIHGLTDTDALYRILEISKSDRARGPQSRIDQLARLKAIRHTIEENLPTDGIDFNRRQFCDRLLGSPTLLLEDKQSVADAAATLSISQWNELNGTYDEEWDKYNHYFGKTCGSLYHAIAIGGMLASDDLEGAVVASKRLDEPAILALADYFHRGELPSNVMPESIDIAYRAQISRHQSPHLQKSYGDLLHYRLNRLEEAEQAYRKAIEGDPKSAYLWSLLGNLLSDNANRFEEAEQAYRKAININPEYAYAWNCLGQLLSENLNRYEEAEQAYREAATVDPEYTYARVCLGNLLSDNLKRYEEAEQAYREATAVDPEDAYAWICLGNLLSDNLNRYEEAEQAYREATEVDPEDAYAWCCLGNLLSEKLKRYEEAEQAYREATGVDPEDTYAWCCLGNLLSENLNRFEEAEQAYRKAIDIELEYAYAWHCLSRLLAKDLSRFVETEQAYRKIVEILPEDADALNTLALFLYERRCKPLEALGFARQANMLVPDGLDILQTLTSILVRQGQWLQAVPLIERLITEGSDGFYERSWGDILSLFNEALISGYGSEALKLLDTSGIGMRWRPLREALAAIESGNENYLNGIAPEVREPAQKIVDKLTGPKSGEAMDS